jgi:ectoine hydroxylase-related dioxygenase (phytanoyl-CoA dioxygenase family)
MGNVLIDAQIDRYHADGILFPVPALGPAPLAFFRSRLDEVVEAMGPDRPTYRFAQWQLCFRWAYDLVTHPPILDAVEDLLGPNILVHSSTAFVKWPRSPEFVSWHQDGHNWRLDVPRLASAWVALTDSTPENGCLRVVPGSHRSSRLEHAIRHHEHNMLSTGLNVAVDVDESAATDVCLKAGEMSFHHIDLVHGSDRNSSDGLRIGIAIRYTTPEVKQERPHHAVVLARGRDQHGHFRLLAAPPDGTVEQGLQVQASLAKRR